MWFFIVILLISKTNAHDTGNCLMMGLKSAGSDVVGSFTKFKEDVVQFFKVNVRKIEERRVKIKNAFMNFWDEAFRDKTKSGSALPMSKPKDLTFVKTVIEGKRKNFEEPEHIFGDLVQLHGYKAETHTVITMDGYILTVHRIFSIKDSETKTNVVLLHHGLLGSSEDWILLGSKKALPYLLVDAGYDVWLTNARGNKYSKAHSGTAVNKDEYWDFSFHEIGEFDLAAVIDYIRNARDANVNIQFIGHSLGATALLVLISLFPQYNYMIESAILLAPLAYMYEVKGPLRFLADFYSENKHLSENLGNHEFIPVETYPRKFVDTLCHGDKILCLNPLLLFANGGQVIRNKTLRANILQYTPAGGSMKTFIHYVQLITSGQFRKYDLSKTENMKRYGSIYPPIYRLNDVKLPVVIFSALDDWLATAPSIHCLRQNLPNVKIHHVVNRNDFSHTDFVWAEDADVLVYYVLLDVLKKNNIKQ